MSDNESLSRFYAGLKTRFLSSSRQTLTDGQKAQARTNIGAARLTPTYTPAEWAALTTELRAALYASGVRMVVVADNPGKGLLICLNADGSYTTVQDKLTADSPLAVSAGGTGANTAAGARESLGMGVTLLPATDWTDGSRTIAGIADYWLFIVYINWLPCIGLKSGNEISAYGVSGSAAGAVSFFTRINIGTSDVCTFGQRPIILSHDQSAGHGSAADVSINAILGIV